MSQIRENYGFMPSEPSATEMEDVVITINPSDFLDGYSKAFVFEAQRVNPLMFEAHPITEEEVSAYSTFLINERIKSVHHQCPNWKNLKLLWIPDWIQYVISLIGIFSNYDYGLKFIPVMDEGVSVITIQEALEISEKIAKYQSSIGMHRDAMPRGDEGDEDVMSCALISNRVKATKRLAHPESSYVAAFAGLTLRKEATMNILYRVSYDDLNYIRSDLLSNSKIITG
jgi:hypothetical protein